MSTDQAGTQLAGPGQQPGAPGTATARWAEEAVQEATQEAVREAARGRTSAAGPVQRPEGDPTHPGAVGREQQVLDRIDRARRRRPKVREDRITLSHGAGGKATHTLIDAVFLEGLRNPALEAMEDAASLVLGTQRLAFTTDSFVVSPLFFPGGDIGDLAINGTVNDLAMAGARPLWLSCGFILEEGFPVADLERIVSSMAAAAVTAGVQVVTGDTKVVQRGKADGCYINTAGIGALERDVQLAASAARAGDVVLVSGPIGDHGVTVMLARGELDLQADIVSDSAPLHLLAAALLDAAPGVRCLRDATRGGVATILNEVAVASGVSVVVDESAVPVRPEVTGACELLGIDPLYVACEGRFVAVVDPADAAAALAALHAHEQGAGAAIIGHIGADPAGLVLLKTGFGGTRIVDLLVGDPLPRIC